MKDPTIKQDQKKLTGVAASSGVAVGPVYVHDPGDLKPQRETIAAGEAEAEIQRFSEAVETVVGSLGETRDRMHREAGGESSEAEIFDAHIELASDPELYDGVTERVRNLESPESAVLAVGEEYAALFSTMDDEYLAARADDVRDVTSQISAELSGRGAEAGLGALSEPAVILAQSLAPSDTARIPRGMALGFVTAEGSKTSHVSIMARSLGVPAVVGAGEELVEHLGSAGAQDRTAAVDGDGGYVILDPDPKTVQDFEARRAEQAEQREALEEYRFVEARTRSGRHVGVYANLGSASEAEGAVAAGAEGVGLFRTEFLFMERDELPTEDEQFEAYRRVGEAFAGKTVIIRTLDVGGDKSLPGVDQPVEENPFLGWRGIRMSLDVPELFKPQLRALLRAAGATEGHIKVMFPMVSSVDELRAARRVLEECRAELQTEGQAVGQLPAGAMIETPAAAVCADELAREADFFSVGTNDLVQYTLAADRGNERLKDMPGAEHPAILRLIETTCRGASEAGIEVGVCGEAAGELAMIPGLVSAGVDELSMSPPAIPAAKKAISELD